MSERENFAERRRSLRAPTRIAGVVRTSHGVKQEVEISDLSEGGCSVVVAGHGIAEASGYSVKIDGLESLESDLRWRGGNATGFEFEHPLHPAVVDHLVVKNRRHSK